MRKIPYNVLAAPVIGRDYTKEAPSDDKHRDEAIERIEGQLSEAVGLMEGFKKDYDDTAKVVKELQEAKLKNEDDGETSKKLEEHATQLADVLAKLQATETAIDEFKKELDSPLYKGGAELKENDIKAAVELQRRIHMAKDGDPDTFKADMDNLVKAEDYRNAVRRLIKHGGLDSREKIYRAMSEDEQKAFEAASLDSGFFSPELLGITVDCEIECASLLDLYQQISVSRSTFMYPHVESYGDIGTYDCDAKCDAEYGPEGNITWKHGQTYDWRGAFCFQRDTLREANYDLLGFMMTSAARSYRINRNRANITGDGTNEPLGWLTADCFTKIAAPSQNPTAQDLRQFLASHPVEFEGTVVATMHQNTFAYFASMVDKNDRFLFGDGLMGYSPSDVRDNIRISNCLPDPTNGGKRGSEAAPFVAGDFIMAAGVWERAYSTVNHRPLVMEQYIGGSTMWCVQYQFGAKDGGFISCCPAARTFVAGSGA